LRTAYLGLGSNEGDRLKHLQAAVDGMEGEEGCRVTGVSPVYESEAHTLDPDAEQRAYLNAVVRLDTERTPEELLRLAQGLERAEGRAPEAERERWAPRPLDVDLLLVGGETRSTGDLVLPHPRLGERRFVLRPLADLAPNLQVPPPFDATVTALLDDCSDRGALVRTPHELNAECGMRNSE
jgi:2-amino-4-hydroxy-6-hydroxymethyldihydropteridine diphosphokinase